MKVVINEDGLLYGGFVDARPVWYRTKRQETVLDDAIAAKVVVQLEGLGLGRCVARDAEKVARKWVPSELAATLDFTGAG